MSTLDTKLSTGPCLMVGSTILLILIFGSYLLMFFFGIINAGECPAQPQIPVFMVVWGVLGIIRNSFHFFNENNENKRITLVTKIITLILRIWIIIGTVLVMQTYPPDFVDRKSPDYCHEFIYFTSSTLFVFPIVLNYIRDFWRVQPFTMNQKGEDLDFIADNLLKVFPASAIMLILLVLVIGPYLVMVYLGFAYKNECPAQPLIPGFLILWGSLAIVRSLLLYVKDYYKCKDIYNSLAKIDIFLYVWFLFGIAWVTRIYPPDFDNPKAVDYCNESIYTWAAAFIMGPLFISYLIRDCLKLEY